MWLAGWLAGEGGRDSSRDTDLPRSPSPRPSPLPLPHLTHVTQGPVTFPPLPPRAALPSPPTCHPWPVTLPRYLDRVSQGLGDLHALNGAREVAHYLAGARARAACARTCDRERVTCARARVTCARARAACVRARPACARTQVTCAMTQAACVRTCARTQAACARAKAACARTQAACARTQAVCAKSTSSLYYTTEVNVFFYPIFCGCYGVLPDTAAIHPDQQRPWERPHKKKKARRTPWVHVHRYTWRSRVTHAYVVVPSGDNTPVYRHMYSVVHN